MQSRHLLAWSIGRITSQSKGFLFIQATDAKRGLERLLLYFDNFPNHLSKIFVIAKFHILAGMK
jgi:hypothetical protein